MHTDGHSNERDFGRSVLIGVQLRTVFDDFAPALNSATRPVSVAGPDSADSSKCFQKLPSASISFQ
jgi:hypothetical protein